MATISAPATHSAAEAQLGKSYEFLDQMVDRELVERFDVAAGGLVVRHGDFAGTGTDTARLRYAGGYGFAQAMTAMSGETQVGTASSWTAAYDTLTIGRYHLAYEESFQRAILKGDPISLEGLAAGMAESYLKTLRQLVCAQGATFSTNVATASATFDVDDAIALRNAFENSDGFDAALGAVAVLKPRQLGYLRNSMRSETALHMPERFDSDQGLQSSSGLRFSFLDIDWYGSADVSTVGGKDYGFAYVPGCMVYGVGGTQNLGDISDASPIVIPFWGIVGTKNTQGAAALKRIDFNAFVGVSSRAAAVAPQFQLQSDDGI